MRFANSLHIVVYASYAVLVSRLSSFFFCRALLVLSLRYYHLSRVRSEEHGVPRALPPVRRGAGGRGTGEVFTPGPLPDLTGLDEHRLKVDLNTPLEYAIAVPTGIISVVRIFFLLMTLYNRLPGDREEYMPLFLTMLPFALAGMPSSSTVAAFDKVAFLTIDGHLEAIGSRNGEWTYTVSMVLKSGKPSNFPNGSTIFRSAPTPRRCWRSTPAGPTVPGKHGMEWPSNPVHLRHPNMKPRTAWTFLREPWLVKRASGTSSSRARRATASAPGYFSPSARSTISRAVMAQ